MEWTEETIARLRGLWAEGHSTAEIGRRMGVSKNAVVGKAHRLSLPARPSPIRRLGSDMAVRPPAPRRVVGPTLPPLPEQTREAAPQRPTPRPPEAPVRSTPAPEPPRAAAPLRPVSVPRSSARVSACCWPIGEPGKPSFRFCNGEALANKPYCAEHAQLAYVKIRDRREEAA
jgi:GcrA cell cycle regulator